MALVCKMVITKITGPEQTEKFVEAKVKWWFEKEDTGAKVGNDFIEKIRAAEDISFESIQAMIKKKAKAVRQLTLAANRLESNINQSVTIDLG